MKTTDLERIIDQFNRDSLAKLIGAVEPLGQDILPPGWASISHGPPVKSRNCDCFCGRTSKGYKSARDFIDICLTLRNSKTAPSAAAVGSVAVGAVIDEKSKNTNEDLPVVLAVGINYGQGPGYLASPVPMFDDTGLRRKLSEVSQFLSAQSCAAQSLNEPFHLVAANFFPWISSHPWSHYGFNSIEEAALIFCCGHADPQNYILTLIQRINPVAAVFHGANNAVPCLGAGVIQRLPFCSPRAFQVVFSDNLAGSSQPAISNAIRLCDCETTRDAMAGTDYDS